MRRRPGNTSISIPIEPAASVLDTVIECLLVALLVFMPLSFGAVEAWSELVIVSLAGMMAVCLALKFLLRRQVKMVWTWAYLPGALFMLLAAGQLLPLPVRLLNILSPNTAATKTALLSDLPNADMVLRSMTLSFYPLATQHDLRLILVVATVFVVVVNVYRRPDQIKRLLGAITIIGAGCALLALAQIISGTGKIYGWVPTGYSVADAGPFMNHSHYGQFMNLSIGAALGLLLVKLHEYFREREVTVPAVIEHIGNRNVRGVWFLIGMIVIGVATVFVSLTRGGMIALLVAGSFTALILAAKQNLKGRGWMIALMALGAFVCILYIGFDAVYDRLATLREQHQYEDRRQIVKDIAVAWTRFPVFGTGLGTHEVVYPMFDRSTSPALASHAENEYAQTAEETGMVGLGLLLVFAGIVWRDYYRNIRYVRIPIQSAAFGLGFGLLAILIHSFSDFGQHMPANACLSALSCGLLVGLARREAPEHTLRGSTAVFRASVAARAVVTLLIAAIFVWAIDEARNAYGAESHWRQALRAENTLRENDWLGTNEEYDELLSHAEQAVARQPANVNYRHWLNVYRWHAISRVTDPETGNLVVTAQTLEFTKRIVDELNQARVLCPTFGATYCVAGQLEKFVLNEPAGSRNIRKGFELAPCDATACYTAGLLDVLEGQIDASFEKFSRALELDGNLIKDIVAVYVRQVNRPDLAVAIAGDNIGRLSQVANVLSETAGQEDLAVKARSEATKLLRAKCEQSNAPAWVLASMANVCRQENDYNDAADYYKRALSLDYGQVDWRLNLAQILAKSGQVSEAIREARVCLRLRPQMTAATKLIEDLSVLPNAIQERN